jgi:hypothetical protein
MLASIFFQEPITLLTFSASIGHMPPIGISYNAYYFGKETQQVLKKGIDLCLGLDIHV